MFLVYKKNLSMSTSILIQVIITCFLGASSPGPSLLLVSKNAISNGKFSGSLTGFGHGLGIFIYAFVSIFGLGLINNFNPNLIDILTLLLVFYMLYLAKKIYKEDKLDQEKTTKKVLFQNFSDGFLICFLNPKITVFFFAVFSQFINDNLSLFDKFSLAAIAAVIDFIWYTSISLLVGNSIIRNFLNRGRLLNKISSFIFVAISIFIFINIFLL